METNAPNGISTLLDFGSVFIKHRFLIMCVKHRSFCLFVVGLCEKAAGER